MDAKYAIYLFQSLVVPKSSCCQKKIQGSFWFALETVGRAMYNSNPFRVKMHSTLTTGVVVKKKENRVGPILSLRAPAEAEAQSIGRFAYGLLRVGR